MEKKCSLKVLKRFQIMNLLCHKVITTRQASKELGLSICQIKRMKKRFKANNYAIESLAFKRTHPAPNRIPDSIRKKIADIKNKGGWRSCQHITELLPDELSDKEVQWMKSNSRHFLSISHDTVRNILKEQNIPQNTYQKEKPAIRFEMANFGELV